MSSDNFQLVSTLITVPPADTRLIVRGRLLAKLDAAAGYRLIHVRAPAGFGKTSLVAAWVQQRLAQGAHIAWLSLNDSHADVRALLRYLVAALRTTWGAVGEATLTLLNANLPISDSALVTTLVNELGGIAADTILVLDDFHCVTSAAANEAFLALVSQAPARLHFLITSRAAPSFPCGRLRELGQFHAIQASELEFSSAEIAEFLAREELPLSASEAAALARNTGGWAAGLRLAAICMREEPARADFIDSFSGGHAVIAEFLQEDVLSRQPEGLQSFLLESGLLDELSAQLCDDALERHDSAHMLDRVYGQGLFLFAIDPEHERFRYHRLFADFLRQRMARLAPARVSAVLRRASAWHARQGSAYAAVDYALRAGDAARAGELLEGVTEAIFASGNLDLLLGLAQRLPEAVLRECPRLALDLVWIHTLKWDINLATKRMADVRAYVAARAGQGADSGALAEKILHREIMIALLQDRLVEAEALWERWPLVASGREAYFDGSAETARLLAGRERFESRYVVNQAARVRRKFTDADAEYGTVWFDSIVGPAYLMCGEASRAEAILRGAMAVVTKVSGAHSALMAMPALLLAEVHYERNELDLAAALIEEWLPQANHIGFVDQLIAGFLSATRLAFIRREDGRATALLDRGEELAAAHGFERLAVHLVGERVRQLLARGRRLDALACAAASPALAGRAVGPPGRLATLADASALIARARLARGTGDEPALLRLLKSWINHAEGHGCVCAALRLRAILASLLHGASDAREAWRVLRPALQSASATTILRPLLDEGPRMLALLDAAQATDSAADGAIRPLCIELHRVLVAEQDAGGGGKQRATPARSIAVSEALTPREREVLQQVAEGASNKEVAQRLGMSEATVKWHLQHAFQKLGVHRRIGAVRKARELGLV